MQMTTLNPKILKMEGEDGGCLTLFGQIEMCNLPFKNWKNPNLLTFLQSKFLT